MILGELHTSYLARWGDTDWEDSGNRSVNNILKHLEKWFNLKPKRILDIGCMNGYVLDAFIHRGYDAWGVEPLDYYKLSKNKDKVFNIPIHKLKGERFDFIFCSEVMEHIPMHLVPKSLKAIRDALTGISFFTISEDLEADPTHVTILPRREWIKYFEQADFSYHDDKINFAKGFNFYCLT